MRPNPLIIIGAGRSGTNALRDALTGVDGFHTWPCDEINYVWRFGNRHRADDEFDRSDALDTARNYIRQAFERRSQSEPASVLVEKTCANSLRVGFVDEVLPHARFVHIVRDGRDVASSAMARWSASLDVPYVLRKALFVPKRDIPYYAVRYLKSHLDRRRSGADALATWGPRFLGMDDLVRSGAPLEEVCARQWAACVQRSLDGFADIDANRVHTLTYDALTSDALTQLTAIAEFAEASPSPAALAAAASTLHAQSSGAWKARLSAEAVEHIAPIVRPLHELIGLPS